MSDRRCFLSIAIIICAITLSSKADIIEDSKAIDISGGEFHTLIVTANKRAWSCGNNQWGQLGIGDISSDQLWLAGIQDGDMNTSSGYLENIMSASAGYTHSLALDANKFVWAWGDNTQGQLGDNKESGNQSKVPVKVHGPDNNDFLEDIAGISAGRSGLHSLAVSVTGNAWSWGYNSNGQLGNGDSIHNSKNFPVSVLAGEQDLNNPYNLLRDISKISAGQNHSVAVDNNGFVYAWGWNQLDFGYTNGGYGYGRLGNGGAFDCCEMPVRVNAGEQNPDNNFSPLKNIISIAAGWEHTLALEKINPSDPNCKGRVYAWGNNIKNDQDGGGQLGDGTTINRDSPVIVHAGEKNPNPDANLEGIIAVSAGDGHSIALDQNGFVWAWGGNAFGQLGNGTTTGNIRPVKVLRIDGQQLSGIKSIAAGYWHNMAIDNNGIIWVWGLNSDGRLGLGDTIMKNKAYPRPPVLNVTQNSFRFGIQNTIDAANNGDILELLPVICPEGDANFGTKSLTLQSTNPYDWGIVEKTIIWGKEDSNPDVPILNLNNNSGSIISGLTLYRGDYGILAQNYSTPLIDRCFIRDNWEYGIWSISNAHPTITNCRITTNSVAGIKVQNGTATIKNNSIYVNSGRGILIVQNYINTSIANNWIYKNHSTGIYISQSSNLITTHNNTLYGNISGITNASGSTPPIVTSTIFKNNFPSDFSGCSPTYSIYTADDPGFTHPEVNDFHISPNSTKCLDKGNPAFNDFSDLDIDGEPRIYDGDGNGTSIVDIGADEVSWPKDDYDKNDIVNFFDYATWSSAWGNDSNSNGHLDGDNDIDIDDLMKFCEDWLWVPPWSPNYHTQSQEYEEGSQMSGGDEQSSNTDAATDGQTVTDFTDDSMNNDIEDNENQMPEGPAVVWLVYDGNMTPSYGEEITVYIHSDANLMLLDLIADVNGDAEITSAMSEADCNNFGWDNGWDMNPYIDPSGFVEVLGMSASSFFEGKEVNGTVGYFKFRYYTGQVNVSISTDSWIVNNNIEDVAFSTDPLIFGQDPNQ